MTAGWNNCLGTFAYPDFYFRVSKLPSMIFSQNFNSESIRMLDRKISPLLVLFCFYQNYYVSVNNKLSHRVTIRINCEAFSGFNPYLLKKDASLIKCPLGHLFIIQKPPHRNLFTSQYSIFFLIVIQCFPQRPMGYADLIRDCFSASIVPTKDHLAFGEPNWIYF